MTVKELIEKLTTLNPFAVVFIEDWNENYAPNAELNTVKVYDGGRSVALTYEQP